MKQLNKLLQQVQFLIQVRLSSLSRGFYKLPDQVKIFFLYIFSSKRNAMNQYAKLEKNQSYSSMKD